MKEDRDVCPCLLTVDFSSVSPCSLVWGLSPWPPAAGGKVYSESFGEESLPSEWDVQVERRSWFEVVASGAYFSLEEGLRIEEGDDCPDLFLHTEVIDARRESAVSEVRMHKEYAVLTMTFPSSESSSLFYEVTGNVCGFRLDGSAWEGPFRCRAIPGSSGVSRMNIPRQTDGSLRLNVYSPVLSGLSVVKGELVRSFALGESIVSSGYDWNSPDLEDIDVMIDFASSGVTVSSSLWTETSHRQVDL